MLLRDSFVSAAPIADSLVLPQTSQDGFEALLCGGRGRSGSLTHMSRGIPLLSLAAFELPPCDAIFSLTLAVTVASAEASEAPSQEERRWLLLSSASGSKVLEASDEISEVTQRSALYVGGPSLLLAPMLGGTHAVQVYASGVRWLCGESKLAELMPTKSTFCSV